MGTKFKEFNTDLPEIVIFSVYQSTCTEQDNKDTHDDVKKSLESNHIPFKEMEGVYQGNKELSFLLKSNYIDTAKKLCKKFNQECYLVSDKDRHTKLIYLDGGEQELGILKRIGKHQLNDVINYTYDPYTDTYWNTEKTDF